MFKTFILGHDEEEKKKYLTYSKFVYDTWTTVISNIKSEYLLDKTIIIQDDKIDYLQKYLKYKQKYLQLKNLIN